MNARQKHAERAKHVRDEVLDKTDARESVRTAIATICDHALAELDTIAAQVEGARQHLHLVKLHLDDALDAIFANTEHVEPPK